MRATLVDGKAHSVDSSDAAFQTAGALALREAGQACGTVLLEPLDEVAVTDPGRPPRRRAGRPLRTPWAGAGHGRRGPGRTVVRAEVPCTELLRYAVDLRAMTSGTASFTRRRARYEVAPST